MAVQRIEDHGPPEGPDDFMPVTTHRCDICGESGEHDQVVDHVTSDHDVTEDNADEYVEPIEDEGL